MLIAMDVGNTNIVIGVYHEQDLVAFWRISTERNKTPDEYGMLMLNLLNHSKLEAYDIKGAIVSSVVPPLTPVITEMLDKFFNTQAIIIDHHIDSGIKIEYENPKEVGADRIVNAVAAFNKYGGPVIVVDFGTATTFDAISQHGEYLGGAISPGIAISTEALFQKAARLPRIEIIKPKTVIGKDTVHSMQAGIVYGFVGQVENLVKKMKKELGENTKAVATGGLSELIAQETASIDYVDPLLTLAGLRIIFDRISDNSRRDADAVR